MKKNFSKFFSFLLTLVLIFTSTSCKPTDSKEDNNGNTWDWICGCEAEVAPMKIILVPLDGMKDSQIRKLKKDFEENYDSIFDKSCEVEILDKVATPDVCLNKKYNRLEAGKMISFLTDEYSTIAKNKAENFSDYYIIGVTNKDISTPLHGKENYGILGLSTLGGKVSVISTFRLPRQKDLWKLALHEYGHGYFRLNHCSEDDSSCIMADAKGGNPHFELKETFCKVCFNKAMKKNKIF